MHAAELVDLAGVVASHASPLVGAAHSLPMIELERYWTASKCRIDRWGLALASANQQHSEFRECNSAAANLWPLVEETLAGEMLARVWAAILAKHDLRRGTNDAEPIGRSVQLAHVEVRFRALSLLSDARQFPLADVVRLNRLRRQCERWTDVLLAQMSSIGDLASFAHDAERMRDYADGVRAAKQTHAEQLRWSVLLASMHEAFARSMRHHSPNVDLNRQIAAGILGCYQPELFDGSGVLRTAWLSRLTTVVDDAEMMVDDYITNTQTTVRTSEGSRRLPRF